MDWTINRLRFYRALFKEKILGRWLALAWSVIGAFTLLRDEFLRPEDVEKWRLPKVMAALHVPLSWWLAVFLVIALGWALEASFRRDQKGQERIGELEGEYERLVTESAPTITLSLRPAHFVPWLRAKGVTENVLVVNAENTGAEALDDCQIRVSYYETGTEPRSPASKFRCCPPFSLVPGDDKSVPVLKAMDGKFGETGLLMIPHFIYKDGAWATSDLGVILAKRTWTIRVEALSKTSRRALFEFGVQYGNDGWVTSG